MSLDCLDFSSYRDFLKNEYQIRLAKNQNYSLRAYARDLNLQASQLNEVLSEKTGLSRKKAEIVAKALNLDKIQYQYFLSLVSCADGRSATERQNAKAICSSMLASRHHSKLLDLDKVECLTSWYHLAILELAKLDGFQFNPSFIAARLSITEPQAADAIQRLLRVGLAVNDGAKVILSAETNMTQPDVGSEAVTRLHRQLIEMGSQSFEKTKLEQREMTTALFATNSKMIAEFKKTLRRFQLEFINKAEAVERKDTVYCMAIQCFPVSGLDK